MYGQPLKPNRASFEFLPEDERSEDVPFAIFVRDLDDSTNDDVREVEHPDWEDLWGNEMENIFSPWDQQGVEDNFNMSDRNYTEDSLKPLKTEEEARQWLLSIGMIEHK